MIKKMTCFSTLGFTLLNNTIAFAQEGTNLEIVPRDQGMTQTFVMIAIALIFFYLILWRPEQKRRKAIEEQRSALKKGDRVTAMGIVGTIVRIEENTVILKMYDGSKIEMLKAAITDVIAATEEEAKKADKEERKVEEKNF
ncbi:Putative preprotein translocase YajC subunit [Neochlamydia sp. S13]|nr:preprotein translocase subunit YajC [Neochlamydia sp. S13]BBI17768.1 Putative preprotein translocase YajC subunit [Neochlamydia sp. S13]